MFGPRDAAARSQVTGLVSILGITAELRNAWFWAGWRMTMTDHGSPNHVVGRHSLLIVGLSRLGERLGVSEDEAAKLIRRKDFPVAIRLRIGGEEHDTWYWPQVRAWARANEMTLPEGEE